MSGYKRERAPGVWELRVSAGPDPGRPGKYLTRTETFRGGTKAAGKRLDAFAAQIEEDRAKVGTQRSLGELLDRWVELNEADWSPTTRRGYRAWIANHIRPALGAVPLGRLDTATLDDFYRGLTRAKLAPTSVRQVHAILRRALRQAVRWGWLPANPATETTRPRIDRAKLHPPSPEEVLRLMAALDAYDHDLATLLRLSAATGARRGEVCGLRWPMVDLVGGTVTIARAVIVLDDNTLMEKATKTHQARRFPIDGPTLERLRQHRADCELRAAEIGGLRPDAYVFSRSGDGSEPLHPAAVSGAFRALCKAQGISGVRLHDLRHFHATQLLAAGIPVKTVSARLGHAKASTTLDIYAHTVESTDQAAADVMGALLAGP